MKEDCFTEHCVVRIENEDSTLNTSHYCADKDDVKPAGLYFTLVFDMDLSEKYLNYVFRCDYDNCNEESIWSDVISILDSKYDIEWIFQIFGNREIPNNENTTTTTIVSMDSSSVTDTIELSTLTTPVTTIADTTFVQPSTSTDSTSTTSIKTSTSTSPSLSTSSMPNSSVNTTASKMNATTTTPSHAWHYKGSITMIAMALMSISCVLLFSS